MGRLSIEKKNKLIRIEFARQIVACDLKSGLISVQDIFNLSNMGKDYGVDTVSPKRNYKTSILKQIYNCPFLLCDIDVDKDIKQILPLFLNFRYEMEIDELNELYRCNFISEEKYNHDKDMIEFCYYKSSLEGRKILNKKSKDSDLVIKLK